MTDQPKTWGEMTDAEKGALLLAAHEGKVIETWDALEEAWRVSSKPIWLGSLEYRVRPERVTLKLYVDDNGKTRNAAPLPWAATHRITFDRLDGELDPDSIKMERL